MPFSEINNHYNFSIIQDGKDWVFDYAVMPKHIGNAGILLCTEGEAEFMHNDRNYIIHKNDVGIAFPGDMIQTIRKNTDFKAMLILTDINFIQEIKIPSAMEYYLYIKDNPCISLPDEQLHTIISLMDIFKAKIIKQDMPLYDEIMRHILLTICFEIIAVYHIWKPNTKKNISRREMLFREFMKNLIEYNNQEHNVTFYADKLCITPRYLSKIVNITVGESTTKIIAHMVIRSAKEMLSDTNKTILQISEGLNFSSPVVFDQYFKRYTSLTPLEYRRQNR
jgi:AraC-like DNA-binding protein